MHCFLAPLCVRSLQFHPEAKCGPNDTAFLFDMFLETIKSKVRQQPLLTSTTLQSTLFTVSSLS